MLVYKLTKKQITNFKNINSLMKLKEKKLDWDSKRLKYFEFIKTFKIACSNSVFIWIGWFFTNL